MATKTFSAKMKDLIKEYKDVLVENLEKSETIDCQPLEVKLKANTEPFFARKAKKDSLHMTDMVEKELAKLIKAGIIERVPTGETLKWISPARFVEKGNSGKLRLVCDLRKLNNSVEPDASIISTPGEIFQSLKPDSKYFIRMDCIQGYHQIKIGDKSKNYFGFIRN